MSSIDFPDLLDTRRPTLMAEKQQQSGKNSVDHLLRSRSRSRARSSTRRRNQSISKGRSASCQPSERVVRRSSPQTPTTTHRRRSLSRPAVGSRSRSQQQEEERRSSIGTRRDVDDKRADLVDLRERVGRAKKSSSNRTPSPSKRRPGKMSNHNINNKNKKREIIDLVDHQNDGEDDDDNADEDAMLDTLLLEDSPRARGKLAVASPSPKGVAYFPDQVQADPRYSDEEDEDEDEDDDEEEEEGKEEGEEIDTRALLSQARGRVEQQRLMEEMHKLKRVIEKKDAEIEQLTGQLRMAISTKCDLVIAHTELERTHEMDLKQRDQYAEEMKKTNLKMQELRAEIEREFMNEITNLAVQVEEAEKKRETDLAEKDKEIELLNQKIQKMEQNAMKGVSVRPESDKVKYYKKKLGMYEDNPWNN